MALILLRGRRYGAATATRSSGLAGAAWADHQDRKHHRKQREARDMIGRRRDRVRNVRATSEHGVPLSDDWDRPSEDR